MRDLVFCIHNHQPVGNFDFVLEDAYEKAYWPFLKAVSEEPFLKLSLHTTGFLLDWIAKERPEYLKLLKEMVGRGQVEIMGGAYYEPILSVIPEADRLGQILMMSDRIEELFGSRPRGVWLAERIWEPGLAKSLSKAGVEYLVLDDYHFIKAGLGVDELNGYYITEDEGETIKVFPGSEKLRYQIPFKKPEEITKTLKGDGTDGLLVYADDGEKFGVWPGTHEWVFAGGWLEDFLAHLPKAKEWLRSRTFSEVIDADLPLGRVYLPTASYMEMGEWTLPHLAAGEFTELTASLRRKGADSRVKRFVSGGIWRNFFTKYEESNWMHKRMLMASRALARAEAGGKLTDAELSRARRHLYMAECNDAYWHGVFGGLYLPHLRAGIYENILKAEEILRGGLDDESRLEFADIDADGFPEAIIRCGELTLFISPHNGGVIEELDFLPARINLSNTLTRRPEAYHKKLTDGVKGEASEVKVKANADTKADTKADTNETGELKTIHDISAPNDEALIELLNFDARKRSSFVSSFISIDETRERLIAGEAKEVGAFSLARFNAKEIKNGVCLEASGDISGAKLRVEKNFISSGESSFAVDISAERLKGGEPELAGGLYLAIEANLMLPASDGDMTSYRFNSKAGESTSRLSCDGEIDAPQSVAITDEMAGVRVLIEAAPEKLWYYPIETVSQSEQGFERIFQGACLIFLFPVDILKTGSVAESSFKVSVEML